MQAYGICKPTTSTWFVLHLIFFPPANDAKLYVHWWDYSTSIPELMQSLNQLVATGKVLYLGISDSPAWVVRYALCRELV